MRTKLLDSLAAVRGFADQSHVRLSLDEYRYSMPDERVIVHSKNANLSCRITHARSFPSHRSLSRSDPPKRQKRRVDFSYSLDAGIISSTSVPLSISVQIFSLPPTSLARSCMPAKP